MNDTAVSASEVVGPQTGIAEYSATERGLAELRTRLAKKVYDVTTTKGMDEARKDRAELRSLRVGLDKLRKQLNEDDQARIAVRNGKAKEITAQIVAMEDPIDAQIRAREEQQEKARQERERAEADRLRKVNAEIDHIRRLPIDLINASAAEIEEAIGVLGSDTLEDFDEVHLPTAQAARDTTLDQLRTMHSAKVAAEAESERLATERAELDRLRAEGEAHRQEQERADADHREAEDKERRAQELIAEHIQDLKNIPAGLVGRSSEILRSAIGEVEQIDPNDVRFGTRHGDADTAKVSTLTKLREMLDASTDMERQAAEQAERQRQLDDQAAEQKRLQQEADERDRIERERQAAEDAARVRQQEEDAIQRATLREAAQEAYDVLVDFGHATHITTRKLAAALAKEVGCG